jgi:hypothetical protein
MPGTEAKRITQRYAHHLEAAPGRVFPLLCPVREYDWIDGWSCRLVHSRSGVVEEGCIFVTEHPQDGRTVWTTVRHDPAARRLEFLRVSPDLHVSRMALAVDPEGAGSRLEIGYEYVSLGERGDAALALLEDGRALGERVGKLHRSLDHYLRTGAMLRPFGGTDG